MSPIELEQRSQNEALVLKSANVHLWQVMVGRAKNFLLPTSDLPNSVSQWMHFLVMSRLMMVRMTSDNPWKQGHHAEEAFDAMLGPSLEFLPCFLKQVILKDSSLHVSRERSLFARKS